MSLKLAIKTSMLGRCLLEKDLCNSHIGLPRVNYFRVGDFMQNGLIIEEIEHVLDSEWQGTITVCGTEDGLQQVVHKLLYSHLQ